MYALLMIALLTSCGRPDLLNETLSSLKNGFRRINLIIHEDGESELNLNAYKGNVMITYTGGKGQHSSIELFLKNCSDKYYLHLEDDWLFDNSYDWIGDSIKIMEQDNSIIKVLARIDSPHPCVHDKDGYGIIQPWENKGIIWNGFSWNPGVTRLDLLKQFLPLPQWEQDLAAEIHNAGYKVVELKKGIYKHIGDGRSTHN